MIEKSSDIPESYRQGPGQNKVTYAILAVVKWAVFLGILIYVGKLLADQFVAIPWSDIHFSVWFIVLGLVFLLLANMLHCFTYYIVVNYFSTPPRWLPMMAIAWLPEIGKYIPGRVASLFGAVWLLRRHEVYGPVAASTVYIINGLWIAVGLMLAVPLTLWGPIHSRLPMGWLWCPVLILLGLIFLHPKIFGSAGNFLLRKFGYETMQSMPKMRHYAGPGAIMLFQWFLLGLGFWCLAHSFSDTQVNMVPFYVSALALAGTLGSLAVFAPGRLGVQEGLLFLVLGPVVGAASAAILVIAVRIIQILADLILAAVGLIIIRLPSVRRQQKSRQEPRGENDTPQARRDRSKNRLHVCVVTTSYPRWPADAANRVLAELIAHLNAEQKVEATVLAPAHVDAPLTENAPGLQIRRLRYFWPARWEKLAYGDGIAWNLMGSLVPWINLPFFLVVFAAAICRYGRKADVIHAHWGVTGALAILTRPIHRRPVIVTVHGTDWRTRIFPIRWLTYWAVKCADIVTTPSKAFWKEFCRIRTEGRKVHFIPNGMDYPSREEIQRRRRATQTGGEGAGIISVGRLVPERRYDLLIRAFAQIKQRYDSATLTLVGDGPCRNTLKHLAAELRISGSVKLVGHVSPEEVPDYLSSCDLYVSPTSIESFGMAVLEAAAYGLPVVTTQVGYAARLVVNGQTGYTVPPNDKNALAEAMDRILKNPEQRSAMGKRMRERIEQMGLTLSNSAWKMAELYRYLAGEAYSGPHSQGDGRG